MGDTFFTRSERKANIDHEAICRMAAYERNLLLSYLENGDRRILDEVPEVTKWITKQLNQ